MGGYLGSCLIIWMRMERTGGAFFWIRSDVLYLGGAENELVCNQKTADLG